MVSCVQCSPWLTRLLYMIYSWLNMLWDRLHIEFESIDKEISFVFLSFSRRYIHKLMTGRWAHELQHYSSLINHLNLVMYFQVFIEPQHELIDSPISVYWIIAIIFIFHLSLRVITYIVINDIKQQISVILRHHVVVSMKYISLNAVTWSFFFVLVFKFGNPWLFSWLCCCGCSFECLIVFLVEKSKFHWNSIVWNIRRIGNVIVNTVCGGDKYIAEFLYKMNEVMKFVETLFIVKCRFFYEIFTCSSCVS